MRSQTFSLGIVSAVALALTSCGNGKSAPDLRCTDTQTFKTVSNSLCDSAPGGGYASTDRYQWYERDKGRTSSTGGTGVYGHRYTGPRLSKGSGSGSGSKGGSGVGRGGFGGHGKSSGS
ncbi:hypothetical protein ACIQGZ_14155 [Streptomyces sp. NPDC092296]|uniref:hypothetical protein n=1 Tax=Streptomyces sp. NPDC092296 TaxID=3366012 RepID=UPI0037F8F16E